MSSIPTQLAKVTLLFVANNVFARAVRPHQQHNYEYVGLGMKAGEGEEREMAKSMVVNWQNTYFRHFRFV